MVKELEIGRLQMGQEAHQFFQDRPGGILRLLVVNRAGQLGDEGRSFKKNFLAPTQQLGQLVGQEFDALQPISHAGDRSGTGVFGSGELLTDVPDLNWVRHGVSFSPGEACQSRG
jgi:hypothetical protein